VTSTGIICSSVPDGSWRNATLCGFGHSWSRARNAVLSGETIRIKLSLGKKAWSSVAVTQFLRGRSTAWCPYPAMLASASISPVYRLSLRVGCCRWTFSGSAGTQTPHIHNHAVWTALEESYAAMLTASCFLGVRNADIAVLVISRLEVSIHGSCGECRNQRARKEIETAIQRKSQRERPSSA
jgi:hypothetical protein